MSGFQSDSRNIHPRKRTKIVSTGQQSNSHGHNPVAHWAATQQWPPDFATMSKNTSNQMRDPSGSRYSQPYKDGQVPNAHARAYEQVLASNKVFMDVLAGRTLVAKKSKTMCNNLMQKAYPKLRWTAYPLSKFPQVWQRMQSVNDTRLFRDLTPVLVPSPELLYIGGQQSLEHIAEEVHSEWTTCKTLGGPTPKPDLAIGIGQSAFDELELAKLKNHTSFERSTMFGESLYFPFLLIEARRSEGGINRADRQNMHSSSMVINAILKLSSSPMQFNKQILVFSISHDHERVKLCGHFAVVHENGVSFHRYLFDDISLALTGSAGQKKVCDFARAVYEHFYPEHLKRIQDILSGMPDPPPIRMTIDDTGSFQLPQSSAPSQETAEFAKPSAPASPTRKRKLADQQSQSSEQQSQSSEMLQLWKEQLAEQQRQSQEQMAEQQRQSNEQLQFWRDKQVEQQRQSAEQLVEQQRQSSEQQLQFWKGQAQYWKDQAQYWNEQLAEEQRKNQERMRFWKGEVDFMRTLLIRQLSRTNQE